MTPGVRNGLLEAPLEPSVLRLRHTGHASFGFAQLEALVGRGPPQSRASLFGVGAAVFLVALLPFAIAYASKLWHGRYQEGRLSFQARDMTEAQLWATCSLVVYVTLLIASDTLTSYTAQLNGGHYPWEPVSIVLIVEAVKLFASGAIRLTSKKIPGAAAPSWGTLFSAAIRLAPVATLYAGNNCLVFFVLARVELGAYVVWRNTTVFFNAMLWTFVLGRSLRNHQWMAVAFLFAGCLLNSLDTDGTLSSVVGYPVLLLLLSALASASAGALNEAVLKNEAFRDLGVDRLNCLLYSQTFTMLALYLLVNAAYVGRSPLMEGPRLFAELNGSAAAIITMQATLGLSVSRVLLYADVVAKTMAGGVREIVQASIAPLFVASRMDWISFPSVIWIAVAMVTYFVPPKVA